MDFRLLYLHKHIRLFKPNLTPQKEKNAHHSQLRLRTCVCTVAECERVRKHANVLCDSNIYQNRPYIIIFWHNKYYVMKEWRTN